MKKQLDRRDFLKRSLAGAAGISPLMTMFGALQELEAAETGGEYRAIVCVLLEGGADVFNMIAPRDSSYEGYKAVRKHLALEKESLLPLTETYGLRDNMGTMQRLFEERKLAVIANVGTLVRPTTRKEIEEGSAVLPAQLFAHNTQRDLWMLGNAKEALRDGWAARAGDIFYPEPNPYFNVNVSDVNSLMLSGGRVEAIHFDDAYISPDTMRSYGFGPESGGGTLGKVYQKLYESRQKDRNRLMAAFTKKRVSELERPDTLAGLFDGVQDFDGFTTGVHETGKPLGKQLEIIAKILSVKDDFPGQRKRQIFFADHHGWDTHDSDNEHQAGYLSDSLDAFQNALEVMGIADKVTTFTISDFGRSLSPNGAGTDHGWGSHAFVTGGAVKGGEIYGRMPQLVPDSPDAWSDRMIPTTAMESYLATIVKWFGATEKELDGIFPNRHAFGMTDMGFLR